VINIDNTGAICALGADKYVHILVINSVEPVGKNLNSKRINFALVIEDPIF